MFRHQTSCVVRRRVNAPLADQPEPLMRSSCLCHWWCHSDWPMVEVDSWWGPERSTSVEAFCWFRMFLFCSPFGSRRHLSALWLVVPRPLIGGCRAALTGSDFPELIFVSLRFRRFWRDVSEKLDQVFKALELTVHLHASCKLTHLFLGWVARSAPPYRNVANMYGSSCFCTIPAASLGMTYLKLLSCMKLPTH